MNKAPLVSAIVLLCTYLTYGQGFTDVSVSSGVGHVHSAPTDAVDMGVGTGAVWFDHNNDDLLDLYVTSRTDNNKLFENNGDGTFTDVAAAMGVQYSNGESAGVVAADINNDGYLDLYLANIDANVLYINNGGSGFTDITATAGVSIGIQRSTSASFADYDGDGYLDLYVAHHMASGLTPAGQGSVRDYLYHNNGDETFTDVSSLLGINNLLDPSFIGGWTDFDNDNDLDLVLITDCPLAAFPNEGVKFWRNDGGTNGISDWTFTELSTTVLGDDCSNGMGLGMGDYDRDGDIDLVYSDIGPANLWQNNGAGLYTMDSAAGVTGQAGGYFSWGTSFLDYNNDGWLDVVMALGSLTEDFSTPDQPCSLFEAQGDGTFIDVAPTKGIDDDDRTRTIVHGDYDGDGDLDLLMVNYRGDVRLFRNDETNTNGYLRVDLKSTVSAPDGVGAKVRVKTTDGVEQLMEIHAGVNLGGGDELTAHFGLGTAEAIEYVKVEWPSGLESCMNHADLNTTIEIREPSYLYVRESATGNNDGSSWSSAYNKLTDALAVATAGDEILVADGTYYASAGADESASFVITDSVSIRGGFPAAGGSFADRDLAAGGTILSGDLAAQAGGSGQTHRVLVVPAGVTGAFVEGVRLTAGEADGATTDTQQGAGVYCLGSVYLHEVDIDDMTAAASGSHICVLGVDGALTMRSVSVSTGGAAAADCVYIDTDATLEVVTDSEVKE